MNIRDFPRLLQLYKTIFYATFPFDLAQSKQRCETIWIESSDPQRQLMPLYFFHPTLKQGR